MLGPRSQQVLHLAMSLKNPSRLGDVAHKGIPAGFENQVQNNDISDSTRMTYFLKNFLS